MEISLSRDARRVRTDLLYSEIRRGTQVAQGRGLQNLHSWVRIPPAPPSFPFQINGLQLSVLSPNPQLGNIWEHLGTPAKRASSSLSIARLCVPGIACVYKFSVVSMVAYPNCCCAILAGTPISCRTKACMWRSFMPRFEEIRTTCARRLRMRPRERDFPHRFSALGLPESG